MTASVLPVDTTSAALTELAALQPWFTPPAGLQVESSAVGCELAAACYALPDFARSVDASGRPRWWPFQDSWLGGGARREELLAAAGFTLAAHATLAGPSCDPVGQLAEVERIRRALSGPHGGDPALCTRESAVDALAFTATCYALPTFARQTGLQGVPLLWPWPGRLWKPADRSVELLTACAMLVAELERHPIAPPSMNAHRPTFTVIDGGGQA